MRTFNLAVASGVLLLLAGASARAQYEPIPGPATDVYPGTRAYRWTFYVPVMTIERYDIVFTGPDVVVRSRRFEYETPGLKYEQRKLGQVPEFHCKYPDWWLPNECGVRWHDVYADFPQLTLRREHIDADVAERRVDEHRIRIEVPRWTWTPRTLTLVLPVLGTEPQPQREWSKASEPMLANASIGEARGKLEASRAESLKAIDDAVSALGGSIEAIEAQGEDASKVVADDGSSVDLYATRRLLLADKATQLERYARISAELDAAERSRSPSEPH
jgi:hypothetical protein